jgi:hypothetical protein
MNTCLTSPVTHLEYYRHMKSKLDYLSSTPTSHYKYIIVGVKWITEMVKQIKLHEQ